MKHSRGIQIRTPSFRSIHLRPVAFSFKVDCPADFDCAPQCDPAPAAPVPEREFDYGARDWDGFRRLMLDRLSELLPDFRSDDPVDLTTTLVEALAYRADQQSYRLDWVATEAFLGSARSRASVARHARLVDYAVGEGASARGFVAFEYIPGNGHADGASLPKATPHLTRMADQPVVLAAQAYARLLLPAAVVFETIAALDLWQWRNAIAFHGWADGLRCLSQGATAATLVDLSARDPEAALKPGDFVLLRQTVSPVTGLAEDAGAMLRHVVRLTAVTVVTDILSWNSLTPLRRPLPQSVTDTMASVIVEGLSFPARVGDSVLITHTGRAVGAAGVSGHGIGRTRCCDAACAVPGCHSSGWRGPIRNRRVLQRGLWHRHDQSDRIIPRISARGAGCRGP